MWSEHNSLGVRSVEDRVSSRGKAFFQLKVSMLYVVSPPAEFERDDIWLEAKPEVYTLNVFDRATSPNAVMWYYVDMDIDDPNKGVPGVMCGICGSNLGELDAAYFTSENIELYSACEAGIIRPNFLLSGVIAKLDVEPYKIEDKVVRRYSTPVLWDEAYPSPERKVDLIKNAFKREGRVIVYKHTRKNGGLSNSGYKSKNDFDEHGGPDDGYGGYLNDRFIDDALGGEADAYWNLD